MSLYRSPRLTINLLDIWCPNPNNVYFMVSLEYSIECYLGNKFNGQLCPKKPPNDQSANKVRKKAKIRNQYIHIIMVT